MPDGDQPLLVGVDAGTSRIRALVFTPDGRLQAEGAATPRTHRPRPGWAEYTAGDLWHATAAALRAAISKLGRPERIVAVGVASVGEAFVPLDQNLEPTAPVIAWYDERAREELSELHDRLGFEHVTATTGLCPDPIFTLLKLLWMKRHQPEMLARTTLWLNIAHFLAWRLGGRPAADLSLASRTLALDLQTRRWADELIRAAGIEPAIFPPIQPAGQRLGEVSGLAAAATSLPQGAAIGLGVHDHIAGALAIGALRRGVLMDSIGTAEALTLALDRPVPGIRLATAGFSQGVVEVDRGPSPMPSAACPVPERRSSGSAKRSPTGALTRS